MWLNVTESNLYDLYATQSGWTVDKNTYNPVWFEGDPTSLTIDDILIVEEEPSMEDYSDINILDDNFM